MWHLSPLSWFDSVLSSAGGHAGTISPFFKLHAKCIKKEPIHLAELIYFINLIYILLPFFPAARIQTSPKRYSHWLRCIICHINNVGIGLYILQFASHINVLNHNWRFVGARISLNVSPLCLFRELCVSSSCVPAEHRQWRRDHSAQETEWLTRRMSQSPESP